MSFSDYAENANWLLIFNATTWASMAINATASPYTNLYVSLHTADPGDAGSQTTSEAGYTSYARVAVVRTSSGWTVSAGSVSNAGTVTFPQCTGSSSTCTHFGIGTDVSGAGNLIISGALNANLAVSNLITPQFSAGQLTATIA